MAQEGGVQGMSAKAGLEPARISTVVRLSGKLL